MANDKTPPSEMIRVPTALIPVVRGLVNLPTIAADTEVAQTCQAGGTLAKSSFTITGRGGLPPNPTTDILPPDLVDVDWISLNPSTRNSKSPPVTIKREQRDFVRCWNLGRI